MQSLNRALGGPVEDEPLRGTFSGCWPALREELEGIGELVQTVPPIRQEREILEEILEIVRGLQRSPPSSSTPPASTPPATAAPPASVAEVLQRRLALDAGVLEGLQVSQETMNAALRDVAERLRSFSFDAEIPKRMEEASRAQMEALGNIAASLGVEKLEAFQEELRQALRRFENLAPLALGPKRPDGD